MQDRFALANKNLSFIRRCNQVSDIAIYLPLSEKLEFLKSNIISARDLLRLLEITPADQQMNVVITHQAFLQDAGAIFKVSKLLPAEMRYSFCVMHQDKLSNTSKLSDYSGVT